MVKKTAFFIIILILSISAQDNKWAAYINSNEVTAVAEEGNYLWLGTTGGAVRYNKSTSVVDNFNKANSGLPHNWVTAVAVDKSGNKWFGTWGGLAKFDGTTWTTYNISNSVLPANWILSIAVDNNNNKWFVSASGITKFDGTNWTNYNTTNTAELSRNGANCVCADKAGNVWFGTSYNFDKKGGLTKFDGTKWTTYSLEDGVALNYFVVNALAVSGNTIWLGTDNNGLIKYDGTWTKYDNQSSSIPDIRIKSLTLDNSNNLWIAFEKYLNKGGVAKFNGTTFTGYDNNSKTYPTGTANTIFCGSDSKIYAGAGTGGLAVFNSTKFDLKKVSSSGLQANDISAMIIDSKGNKWFATQSEGIAKFDGASWTYYDTTTSPRLPVNSVLSLAEDKDGVIWIGTRKGIAKLSGNTIQTYQSDNNVYMGDWVQGIAVDKNNVKWFATDGSIVKYDGTTWTGYYNNSITAIPSYLSNFRYITVDKNNNIWASVNGFGVIKYDGTTWTGYGPTVGGLPYASVGCIEADKNNNIWVGCDGQSPDGLIGALYKFDGTNWISYRVANSGIAGNYIYSLKAADNGDMWIGSTSYGNKLGGGISILKADNTWNTLTIDNSKLPYPWVNAIQFDNYGNAWLGMAAYGVAIYNPNGVVSTENIQNERPNSFELKQNYPNPFNPSTVISYTVPFNANVELGVYNVIGQKVAVLVNCQQNVGNYNVKFDASGLPSGIYIYKLKAGNTNISKKMILIK